MPSRISLAERWKHLAEKSASYYSDRIKSFGPNVRGVDWNSDASQTLRFEQLTAVWPCPGDSLSILDFGCGYGALVDFLVKKGMKYKYTGFDISSDMLLEARKRDHHADVTWVETLEELTKYDLVLASGIFNVRLDCPLPEWEGYVADTLDLFNELALRKFSFNLLTSYSDKDHMRDYLYYASPEYWFGYCKKRYSK